MSWGQGGLGRAGSTGSGVFVGFAVGAGVGWGVCDGGGRVAGGAVGGAGVGADGPPEGPLGGWLPWVAGAWLAGVCVGPTAVVVLDGAPGAEGLTAGAEGLMAGSLGTGAL